MSFSLSLHQYSDTFDTLSYDKKTSQIVEKNMVRVKLICAPINPADINMVEGKYLVKPDLPAILGNEAVGEVIEIGADVTLVKVGDRVFHPFQHAKNWIGFWQTSWIISEEDCMKVPSFFTSEQAAMLSINPITAYIMLNSFSELKKDDWIIQNCASSAVGQWIIFLAKRMGLKTVNIIRKESQKSFLYSIGADIVLIEQDRFSSLVEQKGQIKLALNAVGGSSAKECAKTLTDYGTMVTYGAMAKEPITLGNSLFIFRNITLTGFNRTKWVMEQSRSDIINAYHDFFKLINLESCQIPIYKSFSLAQFKDAYKAYFDSNKFGKVLFINE
ncbi:MAG: hypothetical protein CMP39_04525 [Rickettsiales bacterium]|nr:hypothetical protein [Rickettsiales bacterium]|tara:strand:+ start:8387 stop:9376 length:990 start_codon:yes stop_codon:yes gene_type:complete